MPGIQIHRLYMEKGKYRKLLNEVFGLMKGEKLDAALQESKSAARVDAVQDLMRAAIYDLRFVSSMVRLTISVAGYMKRWHGMILAI